MEQLRCEVETKDQAVDERYGTEDHDASKRSMWLMAVLILQMRWIIEVLNMVKSYSERKKVNEEKEKKKRREATYWTSVYIKKGV